MDIENSPRKLLYEPRRQQTHVSGETDHFHSVIFQGRDDFAIMLLARLALRWNDESFQPALPGGRNPWRICLVRDDDSDSRVRNAGRVNTIGDRHKIRAAPGEKNAQRIHFRATS